MTQRKFWGWGVEGAGPSDAQVVAIGKALGQRFGFQEFSVAPAPRIEDVELPLKTFAEEELAKACEIVKIPNPPDVDFVLDRVWRFERWKSPAASRRRYRHASR